MTNVKQYTDNQLLDRVLEIGGAIPNIGKYMIIGIQSNEDAINLFDDKFYVFDGPKFKMISSGTTNAGRTALLHFDKFNLPGVAVWKTNEYYKNLYEPGLHKGRMKALRQQKKIYFYRDDNKNNFVEEFGELYHDIIYANMHGVSYDPFSEIIIKNINRWSFACPAWNRMSDYHSMIKATWKRDKAVDYCILKEF